MSTPGQHDLAIAVGDEGAHLLDDRAERGRAIVAPAVGNDAEGAAVVAAVLDLDIGPGLSVEAANQMARRFAHGHDVVDLHRRIARRQEGGGVQFLDIADDAVDLRHRRPGAGVDLRRAAGHDDPCIRPLPPYPAHRLSCLPFGLCGHCAGVDDDGIAEASGMAGDHPGFVCVQPAPEGEDRCGFRRIGHRRTPPRLLPPRGGELSIGTGEGSTVMPARRGSLWPWARTSSHGRPRPSR